MKRLILFAALFATSIAVHAAEPIAIEPDNSEQAVACDKYGEGFVYVPKTKICVKISGEVRTTYSTSTSK